MSIIKIAVDLDGTLADIHSYWIDKLYRGKFTLEDITDWSTWPNGITTSQFIEESDELWKNDWGHIPMVEIGHYERSDFYWMLAFLVDKYQIDIVTGRQINRKIINRWLHTHGIVFDNIIQTKGSDTKYELDYTYFVDDYPYLWMGLKDGQQHILFDRPWNQHIGPEKKLFRVNNLESAFQHISRRED